jgi:hypothetical protein
MPASSETPKHIGHYILETTTTSHTQAYNDAALCFLPAKESCFSAKSPLTHPTGSSCQARSLDESTSRRHRSTARVSCGGSESQ